MEVPGDPRTLQNRSKIASGGLLAPLGAPLGLSWPLWAPLGPLLAPLGAFLKRSWRLFGPSCGLLGSSWVLLDRSWRLLESSWALLGRSWGPFWLPGGLFLELFGSLFEAPLQTRESLKNHCFFDGFQGFRGPRGSPKRPRIASGGLLAPLGAFLASLGRLLGRSWRLLGPLGPSGGALGARAESVRAAQGCSE